MLELLIVGSWLFWVFIGLVSISAIYGMENDNAGWCSFFTVAGLALFAKNILAAVSWQTLLFGFMIYITAGAVWSVWRWFRFVQSEVSKFNTKASSCGSKRDLEYFLQARRHKSEIYMWILYWPWSLLWSFTHDLVKTIYESLLGVYSNITKRALMRVIPSENKNPVDHKGI
jgi:hypothetical protein